MVWSEFGKSHFCEYFDAGMYFFICPSGMACNSMAILGATEM
jgi:hypothetical protein